MQPGTESGEAKSGKSNLVVLDQKGMHEAESTGVGPKGGEVDKALKSPEDIAAWKLKEEINEIVKQMGENFFVLSEKLHQVYHGTLFIKWGYETFKDYVESEISFKLRKAQYYVTIWNWFGDLPDEVREKVIPLGWSKIRLLVGIVNEDNVDEWVEKASDMSVIQLELEAKKYLSALKNSGEEIPPEADTTTRMTFQVFDDQKEVIDAALELAKGMADSDKKGNLITLICQDFCTSNSSDKPSPGVLLKRMEDMLGVRLIALDITEETILYGDDTMDKVISSK